MTKTTQRVIITCVSENIYNDDADSPEKLYEFWNNVVALREDYEREKECLIVVCLDTKLKPKSWNIVSLGTVSETLAHPREIMRPVIVANAYAFAIMHNHPSGDPMPSTQDRQLTTRIREVSELMQVRFIDHVIVGAPAEGRNPYFSFKESGHI
jgi:DNA repair protein RadC